MSVLPSPLCVCVCMCLPVCLCVWACVYAHMKVKHQLVMESVFSFHCGSSGDSARAVKVWRRVPLPTEPSRWPYYAFLYHHSKFSYAVQC